jgi:hypothetical protein
MRECQQVSCIVCWPLSFVLLSVQIVCWTLNDVCDLIVLSGLNNHNLKSCLRIYPNLKIKCLCIAAVSVTVQHWYLNFAGFKIAHVYRIASLVSSVEAAWPVCTPQQDCVTVCRFESARAACSCSSQVYAGCCVLVWKWNIVFYRFSVLSCNICRLL